MNQSSPVEVQELYENNDIWTNDRKKKEKKRRCMMILLLILLILFAIAIIATIIAVPIVLLRPKPITSISDAPSTPTIEPITSPVTTKLTTTSSPVTTKLTATTSPVTTKLTTAATTITTEIEPTSFEIQTEATAGINCVYPFAQTPFGRCVNIFTDFDNCGTVGYICPANYTSCSAGTCSTAPSLILPNAIPIYTAALNGSVDDRFYNITLPIDITLYNITTKLVGVTTNGVVCLGDCSTTYTETALPTTAFSGATALAYWDDLYIYANTSQGIYYEVQGTTPNRTLIFEYYCSHYQQPQEYYHFQMVFFENKPGIVQYIYYDVSDRGASCTVGVQASSQGPFMQYSFNQTNSVMPNMTLTFDTNTGTFTKSSIG